MARRRDTTNGSELSSPFAAGGGGVFFENHVQAAFVILMLTGGTVPCLPWPLVKIKLQGKYAGYQTDDFIAFVEQGGKKAKLLAQIKHAVKFTKGDKLFAEVIVAAWRDFQTPAIFDRHTDRIALITGPLSSVDNDHVRTLLEWARDSDGAQDFFRKVSRAKFSSKQKREKLVAFRAQLRKANGNSEVSDEQLYAFLRCFHLLGYDLDIKSGVTLSLLHSHIGQCASENIQGLWTQVANEVGMSNQNAGTITLESISEEIRARFSERAQAKTMPADLRTQGARPAASEVALTSEQQDALMLASLVGAWDENKEGDLAIIGRVMDSDDTQ